MPSSVHGLSDGIYWDLLWVRRIKLNILIKGPIIGPIIGGFMTETLSWRWTFWLMFILSSINTVICVVFLHETYAPVILARKAANLQKQSGRTHQPAVYDPSQLSTRIYVAIRRPLRILCLQPIVLIMAVYMAIIYGTLYLLLTTFPVVFQELYGFSPGLTGLTYLGIGIGNLLAIAVGIPQIDVQFRRLTAKNNGVSEPEFRLPVANVGAIFIPVSLLWYGWSVQAHTLFLVPIIGTFQPSVVLRLQGLSSLVLARYASSTPFRITILMPSPDTLRRRLPQGSYFVLLSERYFPCLGETYTPQSGMDGGVQFLQL